MNESSCANGEKVENAINHVWTFLKDFIPLANTHCAEFISDSQWDKFVPVAVQDQLLILSRENLVSLPLHTHQNCSDSETSQQNELVSYTSGAISCHLENLDVLSSLPEACNSFKGVVAESMSEKKLHEVEVMANAVAGMVKTCDADLVVDVGSGKGYLSLELAGHHKMNVLGLDSSHTNTHGAQYRKEKLKTRWPALVAKANDTQESQKPTSQSKKDKIVFGKDDSAMDRYIPVTQYVTPDMSLASVLSQHATSLCCQTSPERVRAVVAGLHTCGSLAVSAMRLYLTDAQAVALCLVACCYHVMEEDRTGEIRKNKGELDKPYQSCYGPIALSAELNFLNRQLPQNKFWKTIERL